LDRMHREFEGDAAGLADAFAHALGELKMMTIAGREVGPALGDAYDRLAGCELLLGQPEIEVTLEIKRGHARIVGIVEPQLRAQPPPLSIARHGRASEVPCPADLYRTIGARASQAREPRTGTHENKTNGGSCRRERVIRSGFAQRLDDAVGRQRH